jgi:hypothetical protein
VRKLSVVAETPNLAARLQTLAEPEARGHRLLQIPRWCVILFTLVQHQLV